MTRILTAAIMIPAALWVIFAGHPVVFAGVAALLAALCYVEYGALIRALGGDPLLPVGIAGGLVVLLAPEPYLAAVLMAMTGMAFAMRGDLAKALTTGGGLALGMLYIFGPWRAAAELRTISPHWVLFACALNWVGDTAAMYVGKAIGKRKLAPRISPGKTVEGAIASLGAAALGGMLYLQWAMPGFSPVAALGLAVAGNVAGQLGDLAESALKRGAGVKDSGTLLPGHGGVLDRMDSSLFSLPVVLALLRMGLAG